MGQAAKAMGAPQSRRLSSRAGGGRAEAKTRSNSLGSGEPVPRLVRASNRMLYPQEFSLQHSTTPFSPAVQVSSRRFSRKEGSNADQACYAVLCVIQYRCCE